MQPNTPDPAEPSPGEPPFAFEPVPPDLLAFARQTFNMEECLAGLREIQEGRGHSFEEVIAAVEARMRQS